jgi:L-lactate dehydrogenase (cytochrome)
MWNRPSKLDDCLNIQDLSDLARRRLPSPIFHYLDGGAEGEGTLRRNTAAFDDVQLIPKCLVDVTSVTTLTRILGQDIEWPVICAPTGGSRFYHADGELAVARAAANAGTLYSLSTMSTHSLEDIAASSSGPKMFQLYIFKDRGITRELILRCKESRYEALCLTVDASVRGNRERELRAGMSLASNWSIRRARAFASRPQWLLRQARKGPIRLPNIAARTLSSNLAENSRFIGAQLNPAVTWKDVQEIIELWGGPFAIKGIMCVKDATRAVEVGATAVIVSNHGGRQLDGAAATIEVLPEIARAVGGQIDVILDGGIRRGVHILKALALGAKACCIGRPYLFGLAAGGEAGVGKALHILRTELIRAMQLSGCADVGLLSENLVRRF